MSDVMISVKGLSKDYGTGKLAVDNISFDVRRGEVLGFLGPNGAGKSTTMKILTSYLAPTAGEVSIAGHDLDTDSLAIRQRLGYLGEDTPLYRDMTVLEYLTFVAELRQIPAAERGKRIKKVLEQCALTDRAGSLIDELSKGLRQRVGLAQAIIHSPEVVILDEPTSGLDPNQIQEVRQLIRTIGEEKTVILSTHILGEVQAMCSRILIIADGKLVADGSAEDLQRSAQGALEIALELGGKKGADPMVVDLLGHVEGVASVKVRPAEGDGPTRVIVTAQPGKDPRGDIARVLATHEEIDLLGLSAQKATLEDIFRQLTTVAPAAAPSA